MAKAQLSNSLPLTTDQQQELSARVEKYRDGVERIYAAYWKENGFNHNPGSLAFAEPGGRYIRILFREMIWADEADKSKGPRLGDDGKPYYRPGHGQIHSFLDTYTGDVLKPASWKAPAKNARGNLFDASNGLSRVNHYGPEYLR